MAILGYIFHIWGKGEKSKKAHGCKISDYKGKVAINSYNSCGCYEDKGGGVHYCRIDN